jgi:pilus assembly protein CpaF
MGLTDRIRGAAPPAPPESSGAAAERRVPSGPAAPPSQEGNGHTPDVTPPGSLLSWQQPRTPEVDPPPLPLRMAGISRELRTRVRDQLIEELGPDVRDAETNEVRQRIKAQLDRWLDNESVVISRVDRERLLDSVTADLIGYGPIDPLLQDPRITEVMVNGPDQVYVEREGQLYEVDVSFDDEAHMRRIIDRIVSPIGRRVDEATPLCDARLPDGSRVNITLPPISLVGPTLTIRKFFKTPLGVDDLIRFGSATPEIAEFIRACVIARLNIAISGGTGSGKTTLLNVVSSFIPRNERIITIEDAAELRLQQKHVVRFESRPPNIEGQGAIRVRELVVNCLRMRPDRIIVGECRSAEALDMLQAMNTGHDGSLTTIHSNSPRDTLARLETMVLMAGLDLPVRAIREQVSSALDLIVHMDRLRDGTRKITAITEVQRLEGDVIVLQDVFRFHQEAYNGERVVGHTVPTGVRPQFMPKLEDAGIRLPPSVFGLQI